MGNLEVVDASGGRVPGIEVRLESVEFGTPVAAWVHSGGVLAPDGGVTRNARSVLRPLAVTHGIYRWMAFRPTRSAATGTITVAPEEMTRSRVGFH